MKKKLALSTIVILIIIIVIASFIIYTFSNSSDSKEMLEKTPYTNTGSKVSWSINYPKGWDISEGAIGDVVFTDKSSEDIFLNIRVEPSFLFTLEDEIEWQREDILENDYEILSERNRFVNDMNSFEIVFEHEESDDWVKEKIVLIEKDNRVFKILYSAGLDTYDKYASLAEECINTFEIVEIESF